MEERKGRTEAFLINEYRETSDVNEVRNKSHAATLRELKQQVTPFYTELSTMPYSEYVDNFLLVHLGLVNKDENGEIEVRPNEFTLADWISFAGGIHRGVNLVNDRGEYVITVPPIASFINETMDDLEGLPQEEKLRKLREETSFSQHVDKLREYSGYRQRIGDNLRRELFDKEAKAVGSKYAGIANAWHDFFEKLGLFDKENYVRAVAELTGQEYVPSDSVKSKEVNHEINDDVEFIEVDSL